MRKLASVQKIRLVEPIPDADSIEVVSVLGWKVVVRKSEGFKVGDAVVYAEIDSLFPREPQFEFLKNCNYRIKTAKLRGQISQGLVLPLTSVPGDIASLQEGDDVTERLGIVKYEPKIPVELRGEIAGAFPGIVPKTDEPRVQSAPEVLDELRGQRCYCTVKIDGTSSSFIHQDGETWVCSHNWPYKPSETNLYWRMCRKYGLEEKLKAVGNYAVQGEIAGPGVQKNHYGLRELQLFVFNVFDSDKGHYLDYADFIAFCRQHDLTSVPVVTDDLILDHTVEQLLELAKGQYPNGHAREGIVIRTITEQYSRTLNSRASFKVINNDYLLKVKE